jgi:hypothetical protein
MSHPQRSEASVTPSDGGFGRDALPRSLRRDRPPELDLLDPVDDLRHGSAVAEELSGLTILDRPQAEAVSLLALQEPLDPGLALLAAERMRVEPHVLGVGLDLVQRVEVRKVGREGAETQTRGFDRFDDHGT